MTIPAAHDQPSLLPAPADPPVLRCQKCKAPLLDVKWKNCADCRRQRTESYNRWKRITKLGSGPLGRTDLNSSTSSQALGPMTPLDHHQSNERSHYGDPSGSAPLADDQPPPIFASTVPRPADAIEYQWSDELIEVLLALPPRSRYIGKFSIVADPAVNNSTRAHLFAGQLQARAVPISAQSQPISLNAGHSNSCALVSYCTCQEGCQGRFVITVDDDPSHPYSVPGQRIVVVVIHASPPD